MKSEIILGEYGNGGTFSCVPDKSRLIYTISAYNTTWTATENCVLMGTATGANNYAPGVEVNGSQLFRNSSTSGSTVIGSDGSGDVGIPIPKGAVVHTRTEGGSYSLKFYAMATD